MSNSYYQTRAALQEVREEIDATFERIMAAAEEAHPGIGEAMDLLMKKERLLFNVSVLAYADADEDAPPPSTYDKGLS